MAFKVVIGKKGRLGGKPLEAVTLNFKFGRLVLLTHIYHIMRARFDGEVNYVRLLLDEEQPDVFLIQPCDERAHGARHLDKTAGTTPSISARYLFNQLGLPHDGFRRSPVSWDEEHGGLLVHWKKSIDEEGAVEPVSSRMSKKIVGKKK
jgi:hypothetical protein